MMHLITKASEVFLSTRTASKDDKVYLGFNSGDWYWYNSIQQLENNIVMGGVMSFYVIVIAYSETK